MARKPAQGRAAASTADAAAAAPQEAGVPAPGFTAEQAQGIVAEALKGFEARVKEIVAEALKAHGKGVSAEVAKQLSQGLKEALAEADAEVREPAPEPAVARGMVVEIHQTIRGHSRWLPFMVTHVHEEPGEISGVALSGLPAQTSWMRAAQDFAHVKQGEDHRCWRFLRLEAEGDE